MGGNSGKKKNYTAWGSHAVLKEIPKYLPNVFALVKEVNALKEKNNFFVQSYAVAGLNNKLQGHSYVVHVAYVDGKCYGIHFDSVTEVLPILVDQVGTCFDKLFTNKDVFQHTGIGCRYHAKNIIKIISSPEGVDYIDGIVADLSAMEKNQDLGSYRFDLKDLIVKSMSELAKKRLFLREAIANYNANKTNDLKKEWEFRYNDFSGYLNALRKRVKKEISVPNFNFEEFLGNPKSINKIKKNVDMLMLYIARKDKEVYEFSRYAPQMTFLMNDYKTLRKHILSYNNIAIEDMEKVKKMQKSQIIDSIFLQNICDRISPDLEIEIGAKLKEYVYKIKHPDDKQTIPELLSMIIDILQKRYEKNQDAMKIIEYQISEALKNGYLKLGKCESKKARDIIDHIIKNPDSKVHFCGYKREEIRHILPKKFTEVFMAKKRPDFLPVNDNIGIYF